MNNAYLRIFRLWIAISALLLITSCGKEESNGIIPEKGEMILEAGMPNARMRVAYDDDKVGSPTGGTLLWQDNDKLAVVGKTGNTYKKEIYTLESGAGSSLGRFKGKVIPGATSFNIYYPSTVTVDETDGTATLDMRGQTQTGDNNTAHLRDYILLEKKGDDLSDKVHLEMKSAIMKFIVSDIPAEVGNLEQLTWICETYASSSSASEIKTQTLKFTPGSVNFGSGQTNFTAYLSFMPDSMIFSSNMGIFGLLLTGDERHIVERENIKLTSYAPGKRYSANMQGGGWKQHKIALEYVAEYNLAQDGNSFAPDHKNNTSGYFTWYQTRTMFGCTGNYPNETVGNKVIDGVGYHFPSFLEWSGIIPGGTINSQGGSLARVLFREVGGTSSTEKVSEKVTVNGETRQWIADYKYVSQGSTLSAITYGLRYKGHGNLQRSAWRYSYEDNTFDGSPGSKMIVMKALFLGPENPTTLENIANESFWTANASKVVTRIYPMTGICWYNLPPPQSNIMEFNTGARYWSSTTLDPASSTPNPQRTAYSFIYSPQDPGPYIDGANKDKTSYRPVRPFYNE